MEDDLQHPFGRRLKFRKEEPLGGCMRDKAERWLDPFCHSAVGTGDGCWGCLRGGCDWTWSLRGQRLPFC